MPRVVIVMPAYDAEKTRELTYRDIAPGLADQIILVDDASRDHMVEVVCRLGPTVIVHPRNRGYAGNQKTCYAEALQCGADIAPMLHLDHQYAPQETPSPKPEGGAA